MNEEQQKTPPVTGVQPPTPLSPASSAQASTQQTCVADDARSVSSVRSDGNTSIASVASSVRSGIPKLASTAMKPPPSGALAASASGSSSKIGRPCTGQTHKPPVPSSPGSIASTTLDGYDESYRRVTDELNRYKLSDVQEADEYEEDYRFRSFYSTYRNRFSSFGSTGSSMDALWELHPRRMSETGLSRYSDNSTILTEDTDSFIIGQRVWVGGTKPGQIAFIGETQFAPGEWAGIVLDQPIGKNDGSVAGHRYFQCESKRGVFSRLTRLTRAPLPGADLMGSGDAFSVASSDAMRARKMGDLRRSPPANGKSPSSIRSATPLSASNTSLHSAVPELKLGDRVIVSSSQGSKIGTLRYIGFTAFANGEWCGVELDNPLGKNDGSVQGKRYFECLPSYGVFAPLSKVSRSPSKTKPGNCVIHSVAAGASPSLRRVNSRESLASMASSIVSSASGMRRVRLGVTSLTPSKKSANTPPKSTSTPVATRMALQDVLQEKQKHIEQLLKERDLERDAITRAANQADNAEQKLVAVTQELAAQKQQFDKYRAECEVKLRKHLSLLSELKASREDLLTQLDDEKRKNEDIQFKFEEAAITNTDVEQKILLQAATNDSYLAKIKELESQLNSERKRFEDVETESWKDVSLLKEQLLEATEEGETLKSKLESVMTKNSLLSTAEVATSGHLEDLKVHLEESKSLFDKSQSEHNKVVDELNHKLSRSSSELELVKFTSKKEIEDLTLKLEVDNATKSETISTLKTELAVTNQSLEDKIQQFELLKLESSNTESSLNKEMVKLRIEISSKLFDIESGNDLSEKFKEDVQKLQGECDKLKTDIETNRTNSNKDLTLIKDQHAASILELEKANQLLIEELQEIETYKNKLCIAEDSNKSLVDNIQKLQNNIQENLEAAQKFESTISELQANIQKLDLEINSKLETINQLSNEVTNFKQILIEKDMKFEEVTKDIITLKIRYEESMSELSKSNELVNTIKLEFGDLERKYKSEREKLELLAEQKSQLETSMSSLQDMLTTSGDNSAKLKEFMKETTEKETLISKMQEDFNVKQQESQHAYQEMQLALENTKKDNNHTKAEYEDTIKKLLESERNLQGKLNVFKNEALDNVQSLNKELTQLQENLLASNTRLSEAENVSTKTEEDLKKKLEEQNNNLSCEILNLKDAESVLHKNLEEANITNTKLQEMSNNEKEKLLNHLNEKTKSLDEAIIRNVELDENVRKLTETLAVKESEIKERLDDQSIIEETLKSKSEQNDDLLRKYTDVENSLRNQLQTIQTESADTENNLNKTIEALQNSLSEKTNQLEILEAQRKIKEAEFNKTLECANNETTSQIDDYRNKIDNLCTKIQLNKAIIEKQTIELNEVNNKTLNDNNNWIEKEKGFKTELEQLLQANEVKFNESQHQIKSLQDELDSVKKDSNSNIIHASAKDKEISALTVKINELNHSLDRIRSEKEEIKNLAITEGKQTEENYSKQLTELTGIVTDLETKVSHTETLQKDFETQRNNYVHVVDLLHITEKQKQTVVKQLEETVHAKAKVANCDDLINIVKKIQVNNTDVGKIMELQMLVDQAGKDKEDIRRSIKVRDIEIDDLKKNLSQALTINDAKTKITEPLDDNALLEEKLFAESQVDFLNSIILDMKKRTEEQQARIDILESGYGADVADEIALMGTVDRRITPRKYCDICEEFDLHETEDCPVQDAASMPPPPPPAGDGKRKLPEPRPYCNICEVFGHETEKCPEDETY